jgi:hypothetical protein
MNAPALARARRPAVVPAGAGQPTGHDFDVSRVRISSIPLRSFDVPPDARRSTGTPERSETHGRASYTRLKGVSAARRKLRKPACSTIRRMAASPPWLPSGSSAPSDRACGTQRKVENE